MATKRPNPVELLSANAGKIIKRKNQDLKSVAARCGFSEKTLYNILNGKHSATLGKIDDIARALGVHVYELLQVSQDELHSPVEVEFFDKLGQLTEIEKLLISEYLGEFRALRQRFLLAGGGEWNKEEERREVADRRKATIRSANQPNTK